MLGIIVYDCYSGASLDDLSINLLPNPTQKTAAKPRAGIAINPVFNWKFEYFSSRRPSIRLLPFCILKTAIRCCINADIKPQENINKKQSQINALAYTLLI